MGEKVIVLLAIGFAANLGEDEQKEQQPNTNVVLNDSTTETSKQTEVPNQSEQPKQTEQPISESVQVTKSGGLGDSQVIIEKNYGQNENSRTLAYRHIRIRPFSRCTTMILLGMLC
ncbi:hypothetical protein I6N90_14300 [Paenibacillus sp. GSMTC-2017]|uniref:hypothetical protein n=1 Tax=Paenibacillus sp. GSMTC-2017 TaxID=2794350 RepID=UPI0018D770EF|nr:hypothetical protein [Paenibacillus sp. GSMTC-2017]MBH5318973.1 hypothetical protein [Paenibacillus sp. GSMTC-2017]